LRGYVNAGITFIPLLLVVTLRPLFTRRGRGAWGIAIGSLLVRGIWIAAEHLYHGMDYRRM
jgi:hypothetical protein